MSVTCPNCATRFRDPPEDIVITRPLQCSRCDHQWNDPRSRRIAVDAPSMAPTFADLGVANLPVPSAQTAGTGTDEVIYVDLPQAPAPRRSLLPTLAYCSALAVMIGTGAIAARGPIVDSVPQTAALYKAAGFASANSDLKIANITTSRTRKDGISQLIVRGEIANVADATVPVPPIELTMRGKGDAKLYAWVVNPSANKLNAGETGTFTAVARDYPADTLNVEVTFQKDPAKR